MSLQALAQEKFWANKAECEDAEKAYYMRLSGAKREAPKDEDDDFDLFASDEDKAEVAESPKKVAKIEPKKANKGQKQKSAVKPVAKKEESDDDFDLFASSDEDKPPSKPSKKQKQPETKSSKPKEEISATTSSNQDLYLNVANDQRTLVLLKPDAVQRNLMGDIICKFEERGFKMAAMKFISASEELLKNHYADLCKKPFFPELIRYMRSGPIVAMVWTGLNIVPMVRAMVGATKPSDAAPGSIRGDLCVDVGRNLIHASDSNESAAKEVEMWFPEQEIVIWRPTTLEWTYEDEVIEDSNKNFVDNIAAKAGGVDPNILKKINDLEIENKNLKKVTEDLLARVAALELSGGAPKAAAPAAAPSKKVEEEDDDEEVDLFGSDSDSEDDAEKARVREERLAAYHAKKAKKPALIAKTSVVLDIKPWDDETDMDAMLKNVKTIVKEGLLWGASKLVPVGYGINKLRVMCVVEDEKVSIDELCEQIAEFEDFVQSVDIDSMSKI